MTTRNIRLPRTVVFNIAFVGLLRIASCGTAQTVAEKISTPAAILGPGRQIVLLISPFKSTL